MTADALDQLEKNVEVTVRCDDVCRSVIPDISRQHRRLVVGNAIGERGPRLLFVGVSYVRFLRHLLVLIY